MKKENKIKPLTDDRIRTIVAYSLKTNNIVIRDDWPFYLDSNIFG